MPLEIRKLSPELLEIAKQDLNENPTSREADVHHLRDWLCKQPHINARPDDQTLITFLRGCKFSLEKTKKKLDMYYTMRTAIPEFFSAASITNNAIQILMHLKILFPLPDVDHLGRRVLVMRPGAAAKNFVIDDIFKLIFMSLDCLMHSDDSFMIRGVVYIIDLSDIVMSMIAQLTPTTIKKSFVTIQEAYPTRPQTTHFIHTPSLFDALFNTIKSMCKENMQKRLYVHGSNLSSLYEHVPRHILPKEYGGTAGSIKSMNAYAKVED